MERDRLKKKLKKQALKNTLFVLLGIGAIGVLLVLFGTQLLINFSLLLTPRGNNDTTNFTQDLAYLAAPDLEPLGSATNSAKINVSGFSSVDNSQVKLYINGVLADTTRVNNKNEFTFRNVSLEDGENEVKAKTVADNGKESDFSSSFTIVYRNKAPELTIDYPQDGQTVKDNQQTLRGKTDAGSKVTVNGFWAIVDDKGSFTYNIKLQDGDNTLKLQATDPAGNTTDKELKVIFSP